jgi:hypothetical protein
VKPTAIKTAAVLLFAATIVLHFTLAWDLKHMIRKGYQDFTIFYSAGQIVRDGPRTGLYDPRLQFQVQQAFTPDVPIRQAALPYNHPPFEALLFVPLTGLSYFDAYLVWNLVNLISLGAILVLLRGHIAILRGHSLWLWLAILLSFFPIFMTMLQGQDSILTVLILTLVFISLKKGNEFTAGCWLGAGLFRFQLVLPLIIVLLLKGKQRVLLGFASIAFILLGISVGLFGWKTTLRYPEYILRWEGAGARAGIVPSNMPTLHGLIDTLMGTYIGKFAGDAIILIVSITLVLMVAVFWRGDSDANKLNLQFSLTLVVTILVSYHAYAHDLSLLLLPGLIVTNYLGMSALLSVPRKLLLIVPMLLLYLSPLYMFLWFRYGQLNLMAVPLLFWGWGLGREIHRLSLPEPGVSGTLENQMGS